MTAKTYQQHFDDSCEIRNSFWNSVGKLEPDVLTHVINPAFMGGPAWPSLRQAFITVRTETGTIVASDGLTDPFEDEPEAEVNGFELEFYVNTHEKIGDVKTSWQFDLVYQLAQLAANHGGIAGALEQYGGYLTTEVYDARVPAEFITENNRCGVFLGLEDETMNSDLELSLSAVKMVNIKLMTISELDFVLEKGDEGRTKLAELYLAQGDATFSDLDRKSVI